MQLRNLQQITFSRFLVMKERKGFNQNEKERDEKINNHINGI